MKLAWEHVIFCLMAYQSSRVILCQIHPSNRRIVVELFNPKSGG